MRAFLASALVLATSQASAQTIDLVSKEETFRSYVASVPLPARDGAAHEVQLEFLMSDKGSLAGLKLSRAGDDCEWVEIRPGLIMLIGCEDSDGLIPPVLRPVVLEIRNVVPTSAGGGEASSVALTVQTIDLDALDEGETFNLVPDE